eukprot:m.498828 g.498828  ORF g.498828 m.498828 type:complete len:130 (-) comp21822_c0_seq63:2492-2881(-)
MWLLPSVFLSQGAGVGQMDNGAVDVPVDCLPSGRNSFFRQLDHIIATVASVEFSRLYEATRAEIGAGLCGGGECQNISLLTASEQLYHTMPAGHWMLVGTSRVGRNTISERSEHCSLCQTKSECEFHFA